MLVSFGAIFAGLAFLIALWADLSGLGIAPPLSSLLNTQDVSKASNLELVDVDLIDEQSSIRSFAQTWLAPSALTERKVIAPTPGMTSPELAEQYELDVHNDLFPVIDIKLRNAGTLPVIVKGARIAVHQKSIHVDANVSVMCAPLMGSMVYNIALDDESAQPLHMELSQLISPLAADRFAIVVGHSLHGPPALYADYSFDVALEYNESETLSLGHFTTRINAVFCHPSTKRLHTLLPWATP